ncbi:MAG: 50S ribosome-binding GTPase [Candidatus Freyarchaeota archaeon]|nr:50S ribosome-binding GTPase [Candidatus Jordarchaeia archaeon]MBS7267866.1 50S ribosome-binding GTPase [Candidatus Jordarchaeia archaeon]MBS7280855.1 50S ribosome-binding GTPase [Candidatus Jordarchaeia archaeon]
MSFERLRGFLVKERMEVERIPKSSPQIIVGIDSETVKGLKDLKIVNVKKLSQQDPKTLSQLMGIKKSLLEKWIYAAKILVAVSEGNFKDRKKIVFAGLDNAGKTAIIHTLTKCEPTAKNQILTETGPTEGARREEAALFGWMQAELHDLGGKEQHRTKYLEGDREIFGQTDLLIFVIDLQDYERYNEALGYLESILGIYNKAGEAPYTTVFLHKSDAEGFVSQEVGERIDQLKRDIVKLFRKHHINRYHIDNTSIFRSDKLFLSFSSALRKGINIVPVIEEILKDYGELLGSTHLMLFDNRALLIADYSSDGKEVFTTATMGMICLRENLAKNYHLNISTLTLELGPNEIIVCKPLEWEDKVFYIASVLPTTEKSNVLNLLGEELQPWIRNLGVI